MEAGMDKPNPDIHVCTTTPFDRHIQHCHCLAVVFSIHWLQGSTATERRQLPTLPDGIARFLDIFHGFVFFLRGIVQLSPAATGDVPSSWRFTVGCCHLVGAAVGVAFLPVFVSFQVAWTSFEVRLNYVIRAKKGLNAI